MKKIIGVMPLWDDEKDSIWMLPGYMDGLTQAGALPFIFPLTADREDILRLCGSCDGFLLTGGHDVSPSVYGETARHASVEACPARDALETVVLGYALETDKPVLGICRGLQFINAALGGTLYQDLPAEHPSPVTHRMKAPYDRVCHTVRILRDTPLYGLLQTERLGVNSCHHQAVRELAPALSPMAEAEDGLVEALYKRDQRFLWAVQWHPEFSYRTDPHSQALFQAFVRHC